MSVLLSCLCFSAAPVYADTHVITQANHKFSDIFLKMQSNDTIKFVNLDTVNHRLVFTYKGRKEKLSPLEPGNSQEIVLDSAGIYDVYCLNHPEMKMTVFIPYVANLTKNMSNYQF